jgi:serine/threonine protein kinase
MPKSSVTHPDPEVLRRFHRRELQGAEADTIREHVQTCEPCREWLEQLPQNTLPTLYDAPVAPRVNHPTISDEHAPARPEPGDFNVPDFQILEELGRGGTGIVYKAYDRGLKRLVAVKRLLLERPTAEQRGRFRTEAEAIARLSHPHIVQVFHYGEHQGEPFFVLEYVTGGTLQEKTCGHQQPLRTAARLLLLLARAVHAAHQAGLIHRDLKPANVLLAPPADEPALNTPLGCPKVSDFGVGLLGTPAYMAPEQAGGHPHEIGPATDVWALGVILYELLAGRRPFQGHTVPETLEQVRTRQPEPLRRWRPDVPPELEAILQRCLRKPAAERYPTAALLAEDLQRWLEGVPAPPKPRPSRGKTWLLRAGVAVVLLTLIGVGALWLSGWRPPIWEPPLVDLPPVSLHEFGLDVKILNDKSRQDNEKVWHFRPGENLLLRIKCKEDAYVRVWNVDPKHRIVQLFPNDFEKDHLFKAGTEYDLPGNDEYVIQAKASADIEKLRVMASTKKWELLPGSSEGPFTVFEKLAHREQARDLRLGFEVRRRNFKVSEAECKAKIGPDE